MGNLSEAKLPSLKDKIRIQSEEVESLRIKSLRKKLPLAKDKIRSKSEKRREEVMKKEKVEEVKSKK